MLVDALDALRLCRDGEYERIADWRIARAFRRECQALGREVSKFAARGSLVGLSAAWLDERSQAEQVLAAIERGALVGVRSRRAHGAADDDATREQQRLARQIATLGRLAEAGRQYKLVAGADLDGIPDRNSFEVVPRGEALRVLDTLTRQAAGAAGLPPLLTRAVAMISPDWRPPMPPSGLVLLRRLQPARVASAAPEAAMTPSQMKRLLLPEKADIEIRFIEVGSGRPLADSPFSLKKPDGTECRVTTSSKGLVKLTDLDPGQCLLTSIIEDATLATSYTADEANAATVPVSKGDKTPIASAFIVAPKVHRVKSGETPNSISAAEETPWDAIARFNWETTDLSRLQEIFREQVGCTKRTPDGKEYVFDDDDAPGLILIPRPWTSSFAVGTVHTVLVSPLRTVYIALENEAGLPLPGAGYEVEFEDGSRRQGRLGRSGIARLAGVPDAAFAISYPDDQDLLARSLAASIRRAFDEQATGPLFYMLGQSQEVVDQVVRVYEEYFDDLTGNGLAADIDQVVTDSDARPPLVFLCALAGLNVEGSQNAVVQSGAPGGTEDE